MRTAFKYLPERAETETRAGEPVKAPPHAPPHAPPPCGGRECRQQNLGAITKTPPKGRGFVRKSSPSAFVIGRNDWIVGKINHIGGLQNGQVHL